MQSAPGDPALQQALGAALDVQSSEARVQAHVHGFHSYPARMHADTARTLIARFSATRASVLDPFCGSGTVAVEARALGRRALGSDLNPLAVELTRLKTKGETRWIREGLLEAAERVIEHARARQKAKLGPTERYAAEDRGLFAPHVLLELDGLRNGIEALPEPELAQALALVHSALLTKFSQRTGDSSEREQQKRIARGFAIRFFGMKVGELSRRIREFSEQVPAGTPAARVELADARDLVFVRDRSIDLIVSSPPYPGVYDYYEHHRVRLRWLRLDASRFAQGEMGGRRSARAGARDAGKRWHADFGRCLLEMRRVLTPGGRAALLVADSVLAGVALYVDQWLPPLVERAGLAVVGHASQRRPHFHAATAKSFSSAPRREHLFLLESQ